jgi:hypothetical protein
MGKLTIFFIATFIASFAAAYACPKESFEDRDFKKGIEFLKSVEGSYKLGECQIEIKACDPSLPSREASNMYGEVFIKDRYNRDQYAPLYFQSEGLRESRAVIETYTNSSYYQFRDRLYDPLNGARESIYLDVYKNDKTGKLGKVSLGIYGTKRRVTRYWFFHTSLWSVCEASDFKR